MHKIEFYKIEREEIPTGLRLMVDDEIQISYEKMENAFGYHFSIHKPIDLETATEIINEITKKMERQSYDHGAEWRMTEIVHKPKPLFDMMFHDFDVFFRIKDIY